MKLITAEKTHTLQQAIDVMKQYNIENLPVMENLEPIGSISEKGIFNALINGVDVKTATIAQHIEANYTNVSIDTPIEKLTGIMTKEVGAVLAKDETGYYHMITKYDVLQALG